VLPDESEKLSARAPFGESSRAKIAAIDLGSNTFKAAVGELQGPRLVTRLLGKQRVGLGMHVAANRGIISEEKLSEARCALEALKSLCEREGCTTIVAVATRAVRAATNSGALVDVARELGVEMEIVSGEREAELAYLAVSGGKPGKLVCELGSQSMQLGWRPSKRIESLSINAGYQLVYPGLIRDAGHMTQARDAYSAFLDREVGALPTGSDAFIGIAMNTMACFVTALHKTRVTDRYLSHACVREKMRILGGLTTTAFASLKATTPKVDKILSSLILLDYLLGRSGHDRAFIAQSELPVGLIIECFERAASEQATARPSTCH
jgi:hypothetical protein